MITIIFGVGWFTTLICLLVALSSKQKVNGVLRTALRDADKYKPGGRDHCRIPYNQLAELLGWKSDNYPQRTDKFGTPKSKLPQFKGGPRRKK